MATRRPIGRIGAAILVALLSAGCSSASSEDGARSDPAAELRDAAKRMADAQSFRYEAIVSSGSDSVTVNGDYQAPDRTRQTITHDSGTVELVIVGDQMWLWDFVDGGWEAANTEASEATDPSNGMADIFAELESANDVTRRGETLEFHLDESASRSFFEGVGPSGEPLPSALRGRATIRDGLLTDLVLESGNGLRAVISYDAVNAAMPVTPPPV